MSKDKGIPKKGRRRLTLDEILSKRIFFNEEILGYAIDDDDSESEFERKPRGSGKAKKNTDDDTE